MAKTIIIRRHYMTQKLVLAPFATASPIILFEWYWYTYNKLQGWDIIALIYFLPTCMALTGFVFAFFEQRVRALFGISLLSAVGPLTVFIVLVTIADIRAGRDFSEWFVLYFVATVLLLPLLTVLAWFGSLLGLCISQSFYRLKLALPGACPRCDYPRRGLPSTPCPDTGNLRIRCPECGTVYTVPPTMTE